MLRTKFRKLFVSAMAVAVAVAVLAGCSTKPAPKAGETPKPADTPAKAAEVLKEAPMLAELVKAGKLPKLEERLPKEPVKLTAPEVGKYGGTWRMVTKGKSDGALFTRYYQYEPWVRWDEKWSMTVIPGVMSKWEVSPDAKTYTFWIRDGLKWSDGKPYTTDDVMAMWKIMNNKEVHPGGPGVFQFMGKPAKIEVVDKRQFKVIFQDSFGLFLQKLAQPNGDWMEYNFPAHYVSKYFMPENKDFVDSEIKRLGLKDYPALIKQVMAANDNPDLPVIYQFVVKTPLSSGKTAIFDRNPYYWKVDQNGSQLPYLDHFATEIMEDVNTMVMKGLAGDIDMQDRHFNTNQNKPVFIDGQQKGNYKLFETTPTSMNQLILALNLTHKDPELRKIFQNKNFRIALSHAINRKQAIDTIYVGQGEPWNPAPLKEAGVYYDEQMGKQYTEYDVAKANQLLDEMGMKKGANGMRTRPDGKPFTFTLEVANNMVPTGSDYGELLRKFFAAVGIDMAVKVQERTLFYDRKKANEVDATLWGGDGGVEVLLEQRWYFPNGEESNYAIPWAQWWTSGGKQGEKPPEAVAKQQALYDQLQASADPKKQEELMKEILKIAKDQFYAIGLCTVNPGYGIVRNDMHNVPKKFISAWLWPSPGPLNTSLFWTDRK